MISYIQIGWKDEFSSTRILFHLIGKNIYETEIPCRAKQGESASNKALRGAKQSASKQGSSGSKTRGGSPGEALKTFSLIQQLIEIVQYTRTFLLWYLSLLSHCCHLLHCSCCCCCCCCYSCCQSGADGGWGGVVLVVFADVVRVGLMVLAWCFRLDMVS